MTLKPLLVKLHWLLSSQFGLDPFRFLLSLRGIPAFVADWIRFRRDYTGKMALMPCLHDRYQEGGTTKSEYFWQDLLVARWIFESRPLRHVDIGSRVDGFVAHVSQLPRNRGLRHTSYLYTHSRYCVQAGRFDAARYVTFCRRPL